MKNEENGEHKQLIDQIFENIEYCQTSFTYVFTWSKTRIKESENENV